jgi:hypothetical protein
VSTAARAPTHEVDGMAVAARRDRLVVSACGCLAVLQALPYVTIGWITDGGTTAGDGALDALSPASLLGVVGFGIVLAVALTRPGLRPLVDGGVDVDGRAGGPLLATRRTQTAWTSGSALSRLRWAALASLAGAASYAGAVLLESAAGAGAWVVGDALDRGSVVWTCLATLLQVLLMDVRAPVAAVVALVVLTRAQRPVSPTGRRPGGRERPGPGVPGAARTTPRSQGPPPS